MRTKLPPDEGVGEPVDLVLVRTDQEKDAPSGRSPLYPQERTQSTFPRRRSQRVQ